MCYSLPFSLDFLILPTKLQNIIDICKPSQGLRKLNLFQDHQIARQGDILHRAMLTFNSHQPSSLFLHPSFLSLRHYSRDSSICSSPTELPYIYSLYRVMLPYDAMKQNYPHSFLIFQFHLALYFSNLLLTFLHSAFFYLQLQCSSCSEEAVQNHL